MRVCATAAKILDADVGNRKGHVDDALAEFPFSSCWRQPCECRCNRRRDRAVQPRHRRAPGIDARFQMLDRYGMVEDHVCRSSSRVHGDLDRPAADRPGQTAGLDAVIGMDLRPDPPPSSVTCTVTSSIRAGRGASRPFRARLAATGSSPRARTCPGSCARLPPAAPSTHAPGAEVILRRDAPGGARGGGREIAVIANHGARPARGFLERGAVRGRVVARMGPSSQLTSSALRPCIAAQVLRRSPRCHPADWNWVLRHGLDRPDLHDAGHF